MSAIETTPTPDAPEEPHGTDEAAEAPTVDALKAELEDVKRHSRKWEERAKSNKAAADRLAELERERMTDDERRTADLDAANTRADEAEARAAEAEAALVRLRLAVELGLSSEDAEALSKVKGDEDTLRALAERLADRPGPRPNPGQGKTRKSTESTADQFAAVLGGLL
ncbi:hypothetical protein [Nocardioides ochotonae]|uniref:hypothetical protein n=1 Tax=Nocardioides ochotonae TaxID=2685869 RepID=UPI00140D234C|nr:hypothetical protein [Nocardioides ochotonae]